MEAALGRCWQGMLAAMAEQDQPRHSLAAALRQKGALVQDLLRSLETGLQHGSAAVRSACYTFWHTPSVQCMLGRHLPGVQPSIYCDSDVHGRARASYMAVHVMACAPPVDANLAC